MKAYFTLQYKMFNRKMIDFGMPLLFGYTLIPIVFIFISNYIFSKTEFASYAYILLAISILSRASDTKKNDFLKSILNPRSYLKLRIIENFIWSLPFLSFLAYKKEFIFVLTLVIFSIFMALINLNVYTGFTIPTPFSKKPFEYPVGFRKTFFIFPITYFLTFISISVSNFNLGVFSIILTGLICMSYYSKPEDEYFVWNFNLSAKTFLLQKIKISLLYFSFLALPSIVGLAIFFSEEILVLVSVLLLIMVYLGTFVLAKYSAYPHEMNLPQGILILISMLFPPALLGIIPYFYKQSVLKLSSILNDSN